MVIRPGDARSPARAPRALRGTAVAAAAAGALVLAGTPPAWAQPPVGSTTLAAAVTGFQPRAGDLAAGGEAGWTGAAASLSVSRRISEPFSAGVSLRYEHQDWSFDEPDALGGRGPWDRLHRAGGSVDLRLALSRALRVGLSPTIEWAWNGGAGRGDALVYGTVVSAAVALSPRLLLGGGASITRQFYAVKTSAFAIVNWAITDRLRIGNAVPSGPEGGAGVELRYDLAPVWQVAGGGVYRSDRYRLATRPDGGTVGEASSILLLARVTRALDPATRVDLYAGVTTRGRLAIRNDDGDELSTDDLATAPAVALTLRRDFRWGAGGHP